MAYYYVKSGGTATGDAGRYTTIKANNSWATEFTLASQYYDNLERAVRATTTPTAGDFILVSSSHNTTVTPDVVDVTFDGGTNGVGLTIMSVDDSAIQEYKPGATELITGTQGDYRFAGEGKMMGFKLQTGDNVLQANIDETIWEFHDMHLQLQGALDVAIYINVDGCRFDLYNTVVECIATNITYGWITVGRGCVLRWIGGGAISTGNGLNTELWAGGLDGGGGQVHLENLQFTNVINSPTVYPVGANSTSSTHAFRYFLKNCKFDSTVQRNPIPVTDLSAQHHEYKVENSNDTTDGRTQYLYYANGLGSVETSDTVYVTGSSAFDGSDKQSFQLKTGSHTTQGRVFRYPLLKKYIDLSTDSTSKIIVHLVTDASLNDNQLWAECRYIDGTADFQTNFASSAPRPSGTVDTNLPYIGTGVFSADGTALSNDATYGKAIGDWTGATGLTPYTLVLDTAGDAGRGQMVEVEICCNYNFTGDSDVLYISSELEVGT
jgi:hypothetical protein